MTLAQQEHQYHLATWSSLWRLLPLLLQMG
jgi:hypothetical protein